MARITVVTVVRAVLAIAVAFLLFVGVGPRFFHYRVLTVLSGSMRPTAAPGDLIVDTPMALDRIRVGDVITYQIPVGDHHVVSHRVIEVRNPGSHPIVRTQGDANNTADPWAATLQDGPVWKMRHVVPKLGRVIYLLRRRRVMSTTTRLVPVLLAVVWLSAIWRRDAEPTPAPTTS